MKLSTTRTKTGRVNVFADGEYRFTVPFSLWCAAGLDGAEADEEALSDLRARGERADAYEKAVSLLARRDHGEQELYRKLRRLYSGEASAAAIARCRENGLTDDARFAAAYAEELFRKRGFSPERITEALLQRGIDRETAKNAVRGLDIDRKSAIIDIIKKMHLPEALTQKELDRVLRRLTAAGYSMREIRAVLRFTEETEE